MVKITTGADNDFADYEEMEFYDVFVDINLTALGSQ